MKIGSVRLTHPFALAPMAGVTDTAFRRLVKGMGGCGLVVTGMVSAEGLVRGISRTLEHAAYTEDERPISIQIFGGNPDTMAAAADIVESMGADIVDVNMGCPVPKIASRSAGCSLMREPARAAAIVRAMTRAVKIPVTVKMRAGWNEKEVNAPTMARMVEDAGAAAITVHGRTAAQAYKGHCDWRLIEDIASSAGIPVFGSGDCLDAVQMVARLGESGVDGVFVGRGALRNPWIFAQATDVAAGRMPRAVTTAERGEFLFSYLDLLLSQRTDEAVLRHPVTSVRVKAPRGQGRGADSNGEERWVINKLRALASWYTKGFNGGSRLRVAINTSESIPHLRDVIAEFFLASDAPSSPTEVVFA